MFEEYVFSNYLFAEGFGCVVACPLFLSCELNRVQITNQVKQGTSTNLVRHMDMSPVLHHKINI